MKKQFNLFKGVRNDEDIKQIPFDFLWKATNFNYPNDGVLGIEKILMPERVNQLVAGAVDGLIEYRFLDSSNNLQTQFIGVAGGTIYKNILTTPVVIYSGISAGKVSFQIYKDKLFIANGIDPIWVYNGLNGTVYQMGAPEALPLAVVGNPNGVYRYQMSYVTAGGEEIIGTISNAVTVVNSQITLNLPIGYAGTTSRKLYRTEAGGTVYKELATVANNTDLTFVDNIADSSLGDPIPDVTIPAPRPQFLCSGGDRLFCAKMAAYPTQVGVTDTALEVIDMGNSTDIANYGADNTAVEGIGVDFDKIVVGTAKTIAFIDPASVSVQFTRANVGIKDGFSMANVPAFGEFPGGLMFVSTEDDVRLMSGLQALPVSTSLDNIRTQNLSQYIRGTFKPDVQSAVAMHGCYHNYRYHLSINNRKYVFDIRTQGWTTHDITSTPSKYNSSARVLYVINGNLLNGQADGWIEQEYVSVQYRGEDVRATLESTEMETSSDYKYVEKAKLWFHSSGASCNMQVITDGNSSYPLGGTFTLPAGDFDATDFDPADFFTASDGLDYKIVNIQRPCRWLRYSLTCDTGNISFQGFELHVQDLNDDSTTN
jgi:hypothetical protein